MSLIPFPLSARKRPVTHGAYEPGMKVHYDATARTVTVSFRGRIMTLPGQYATPEEARWVGEAYCRENGWNRDSTKLPLRNRSLRYGQR